MSDKTTERSVAYERSGGRTIFRGALLPTGPWDTEPDHEDLRSDAGLPCILHRNRSGAWCGYVGVPPGHPWHGKDYGEIESHVDVHGGLTYSDRCQGDICHVARPGESDDVWWLGFDCIHSGDLSFHDLSESDRMNPSYPQSYKTISYARGQVLALAEQAAAARAA